MAKNPKKNQAGLAARSAASEIIWHVLFDQVYIDEAFTDVVSKYKLDHRDRGLVRAITATTLRRLGQIKLALDAHMKKPLAPKFSHASCILHTAGAQILFMDVPDHAVIDLAVSQLRTHRKLHHLSGMANAVLRKLVADKELQKENNNDKGDEQTDLQEGRINTPKWLWQLWAKDYGKETAAKIANAHLLEPALDVTLKSTTTALQDNEEALSLPTGSLRFASGYGRIEELAGYDEGEWWVQDVAATLPVKLLGDITGKKIADICAAPGGKTMQLCAAGAIVSAVDFSERRLEKVDENLQRTNLKADIICADAREWQPDALLDAVLLDAPCSATGTIRRHPDALHLKKSSDIDTLCKLQKQLLAQAALMIKPGGIIIYCTCSLQKREGELQVEAFLSENTNFENIPVCANEISDMAYLINENGDIRTLPFHAVGEATGMDGFFISRLKRKS